MERDEMAENGGTEGWDQSQREEMSRFEKQAAFFLRADGEKGIVRQTYIGDGSRKESDAEHAWSLALGVLLFSEYANEKIDVLKTITMVLIHDIVEIEAGDTYAYDYAGQASAHEREKKAAEDLFGMLPEDQGQRFYALWEEFEAYESPEACFAHTLDNFQPLQLNGATGGRSWAEHGVRKENVLRRNEKTPEGSEKIWAYMRTIIDQYFPESQGGALSEEVQRRWGKDCKEEAAGATKKYE